MTTFVATAVLVAVWLAVVIGEATPASRRFDAIGEFSRDVVDISRAPSVGARPPQSSA